MTFGESTGRPRRHEITASDGVILVADVAGADDSPTVVLMHGGGQTRHSWTRFAASLAGSGYHVINYDARGHGESGWSPDGNYSHRRRAEDLMTVVATIRTPCALVGASLGGFTALQAVSDGYKAGALILVDIVLNPDPAGVQRIREFMLRYPGGFTDLEEAAAAVATYNPERPRSHSSEGLMRNLRRGPGDRLYWHWDPRILPVSANEDRTMREEFLARLRLDQSLPTLLIRGLRSDVVTDANVAQFKALLPTLKVDNVSAAGHMVAGDDNDQFNKSAIDFLQRVFPAEPGLQRDRR